MLMPRGNGDDRLIKVTGEARHWIEYAVLAFVIITAVATAMAAWYTRKEWQSSIDNGHRQLRAYAFPDQATLEWEGTGKPTVAEIVIKNSGQTPAYKLSTSMVTGVGPYPPRNELIVPAMPANSTVVPPAGSYSFSVATDKPLSRDQLEAIKKGTQAIYAFGKIAYTDAFGECRETQYKFYYVGAGTDVGGKVTLAYLDEGSAEVLCSDAK
jgi:hypothetical protein